MKRVGKLYNQIGDRDNLCLAFWKAAKGKHDRRDVTGFKNHFEENIRNLREQLLHHRVRVGDYHFFYVHDPYALIAPKT